MIPKYLIRNENESTEAYCWRLMTDYKANPEELRFSYNYTDKEGEQQFSKHLTLMQLWHYAPEEKIRETKYHETRTSFFSKIQHRTILPCELTFDIDDKNLGEGFIFQSIKAKAQFILNQLESTGYNPITYFTGHKSYHITCIMPEWVYLEKRERTRLRQELITKYDCDLMKANEGSTIACEGAIHYRSGKKKEMVVICDG